MIFLKKVLTNESNGSIILHVIQRQQVPVKAMLSCRGETQFKTFLLCILFSVFCGRRIFLFYPGGIKMPSKAILEQKQQVVAELTEKIKASVSGVVVNYQGITVEDDTKMRKALREAGVSYHVFKNSITGRACENCGYGDMKQYLNGMTAIAVSENDAVAPAKILKEYADKIESFKLLAGYVDGAVIDTAAVEKLAAIPSKETLITQLLVTIRSPLVNFVYVLDQAAKAGETAPAAEEAAPAEA